MTQTLQQVSHSPSNKKYIIRYKDIPLSRHDARKYPDSQGEWYYCYRHHREGIVGTWRHISFIKDPMVSEWGGIVTEKFEKITEHIYTDNQLEIVEFTEELEQEFVISILKHAKKD